jgi:hypothetical protein
MGCERGARCWGCCLAPSGWAASSAALWPTWHVTHGLECCCKQPQPSARYKQDACNQAWRRVQCPPYRYTCLQSSMEEGILPLVGTDATMPECVRHGDSACGGATHVSNCWLRHLCSVLLYCGTLPGVCGCIKTRSDEASQRAKWTRVAVPTAGTHRVVTFQTGLTHFNTGEWPG